MPKQPNEERKIFLISYVRNIHVGKFLNFSSKTSLKINRNGTQEMFTTHLSDKELASKIHKEILQLKNKMNNLIKNGQKI